MSFTSQVGQVIQGDSATSAATWVPTLSAGVDNKKFMVTADPAEFSMNTPLILNDNYYHRSDDITRASYITDSPTQKTCNIQGVTANMAYLNSGFIEFEMKLTFAAGATVNDETLIPNILDCVCDLSGQRLKRFQHNGDLPGTPFATLYRPHVSDTPFGNNGLLRNMPDYIPYMNGAVFDAPSFWQMEIIQNITVEIGNNVQTLGRSAGQNVSMIKAMNSLIAQDDKLKALFGFFNSEAGLSPYNNVDYVKNDPLMSQFYRALTTYANPPNGYDGGNNATWYKSWNFQFNDPALDGTNSFISVVIPIKLPLKYLNSAFNQPLETWWPAGMPFKITLDFYTTPKVIFTSPYIHIQVDDAANPPTALSCPLWQWTATVGDLKNTSLYMQTHLLRQPTQEAINLAWTASPYLYQYITCEPIRYTCDGVNTLFNFNLAINQQCPTHVIMYAEWAVEPPNGVYQNIREITANVPNEQGTYFFKGRGPMSDTGGNNATTLGDTRTLLMAYQRHGYRRNSPEPIFINAFRIVLTGTKKYEWRWNKTGWINIHTGAELLKDMISFSSYNRHDINNNKSIKNTDYGVGNYYHLTLHPGLMLDIGYQSTDWGAQVINIEIEVFRKGVLNYNVTPAIPTNTVTALANTNPLPNTHQFTVIKVLPEQYNLDINRNVSVVRYPAVTTTSGYILPTASSINTN